MPFPVKGKDLVVVIEKKVTITQLILQINNFFFTSWSKKYTSNPVNLFVNFIDCAYDLVAIY